MMLKLCLKDVLGQSRREDNGREWAAGFPDGRRHRGEQRLGYSANLKSPSVGGGVWSKLGDMALEGSVEQIMWGLWAFSGVWMMKLWDTGMSFIQGVVDRLMAPQRCHVSILRTCEYVTL